MKSTSVSASLRKDKSYSSDQAQVWAQVHELQLRAGCVSPTSAMSDVFDAYNRKSEDCLAHLACQPGQQGILVLHNGRVSGLDLVSRPEVYSRLHQKLLRSYLLEALMETEAAPSDPQAARDQAGNFLGEITHAGEEKFQSVGYGWDFRLRADGLAGNALVADDHVIHTAVFKVATAGTRPQPEPSESQTAFPVRVNWVGRNARPGECETGRT